MKNILIVFSGKAQSGKSTSAGLLKQYLDEQIVANNPSIHSNRLGDSPVQIHSFAKALKEIAKEYFGWDGSKEIFYEPNPDGPGPRGAERAFLPVPDKGRTLLLNIGKKFREIRPTIWVDYVINNIKRIDKEVSNTVFVIDDLRFKNELALAKTFHTCVSIRLQRDEGALDLDDISEKDLDDATFDYYLKNNGSQEELKQNLGKLFEEIKRTHIS